MNRTQNLAWRLINGHFSGEELLLEALLRRGFLAFRDEKGVWLGTGSHALDVLVLKKINSLTILDIKSHIDRMCEVRFANESASAMRDAAYQIISLGEHHRGVAKGPFTAIGFSRIIKESNAWRKYGEMQWGAKLPVCPASQNLDARVNNSLDTGIALLVKVFPLIGVATSLSCDGHGVRPAEIDFAFQWDHCWGSAVFNRLDIRPVASNWLWGASLRIEPRNGYDDESLSLMLNDIQQAARAILNKKIIKNVRAARLKTIKTFSGVRYGPTAEAFINVAVTNLKEIVI